MVIAKRSKTIGILFQIVIKFFRPNPKCLKHAENSHLQTYTVTKRTKHTLICSHSYKSLFILQFVKNLHEDVTAKIYRARHCCTINACPDYSVWYWHTIINVINCNTWYIHHMTRNIITGNNMLPSYYHY